MEHGEAHVDLKRVLGALIFGANRSLSVKEMLRCLAEVAETEGGKSSVFGRVREADVLAALEELKVELDSLGCGFILKEVAGGFSLQSDASCGKWLKHLLDTGRPSRLSRPALETLAIIAYRQPVPRSEIESVRGVNVDHVIKTLLEMQLIRIAGRSDLPGRPFLYATTHGFLEHFGLKDLAELNEVEPSLRAAAMAAKARAETAPDPPAEDPPGEEDEDEFEDEDDEA